MFTPGSRACGYKTASGRAKWLNRDPIGEHGGLNLYGFVFNDPVNLYDPDGRIVPFIIGAIAAGGGVYLVADWAIGLYDNYLNQQLAELENSNLDRLMDADPNDIDPDAMQRSRRNLACLGARSVRNLSNTPGTFHNGQPTPVLPPFTVKASHLHADAAAHLTGRPGYVRVAGYYRQDGTYVSPYYRRYPGSSMPPPDNDLYPRGR